MLFRPGDVLLFENTEVSFKTIFASAIRLITGNKVIHVGIVLDVKHYNPDWLVWTEASIGKGKLNNLSSTKYLVESSLDDLRLMGVAHLPDKWYECYPIEDKFMIASDVINQTREAKHYSYRIIFSQMIDHFYRRFRPATEPYRNWLGSNGYVCSTLCVDIINRVMNKYVPEWDKECNNINVWEPDDFTASPFMVELCNLKIT